MDSIITDGKLPLLFMLLGLLLGFGFARLNTRLIRAKTKWWPFKDIEGEGFHLHHMVFGVILMVLAGTIFIAAGPDAVAWASGIAFFFGVGTGLVLDEFALILHLRDVYWSQEGRQSIGAVILVAVFAGFLIVGFSPFGVNSSNLAGSLWVLVAAVVLNLALIIVVSLKGKYYLAFIGLFITPVAIVAAVRLARPSSPWARSRYPSRPKKLERALKRGAAWDGRKRRVFDFIGGRPTGKAG